VDYQEFIQDFLIFDPKMFHISDGMLSNEKDEHLNIGEGDYDIEFLMNCVNRSELGYVTLETPRTKLSSLEEDLENCGKLI
jgi:deoxyribonuclease-4